MRNQGTPRPINKGILVLTDLVTWCRIHLSSGGGAVKVRCAGRPGCWAAAQNACAAQAGMKDAPAEGGQSQVQGLAPRRPRREASPHHWHVDCVMLGKTQMYCFVSISLFKKWQNLQAASLAVTGL